MINKTLLPLLRIAVSYLPGVMPRYLGVESVNYCNLKCPVCATSQYMKRKRGEMTPELFKILLSQIAWKVEMINFGYSGEPLLNKQLFTLIRMAKQKGIKSGFDTNGFFVEDYAQEIISSGVHYVNIALDGASQEKLVKYRVGSDFEKVLRGIKKLSDLKRSSGGSAPFIALQFLLMRHNEDDLDFIKGVARDCHVDALRVKSFNLDLGFWHSDEERKRLLEEFGPENKQFSRYLLDGRGEIIKKKLPICVYPFTSPVILFNGDVSLCCLDFNGEYIVGNITKDSLRSIWKNKAYNALRRKAMIRKLEICRKCSFDYSVNKNLKF